MDETINSVVITMNHPFIARLNVDNLCRTVKYTRMWANAQRDGRPAEHRWRPLFNAAKLG